MPRKSAFHWLDLTIAFVFRTMTLLRSLENLHPIGADLPRHCEAPLKWVAVFDRIFHGKTYSMAQLPVVQTAAEILGGGFGV